MYVSSSKISPCIHFETVDLSTKVDDLAIQSAKLEKDLAETIALFKNNVSSSAEKTINPGAKHSAASAQPLAPNLIDRCGIWN